MIETACGDSERLRIIRGDCLEEMKKLKDKSIDLCLTDPPYGTTACKWDTVIPFEPMWEQLTRVVKDNGAICLFGQQPFSSALVMSKPKLFKYEWIWRKPLGTGFLNAKKYPLKDHENILVFCRKPHTYNPQYSAGKPYSMTQRSKGPQYGNYELITTVSDGKRYPKTVLEFAYDKEKIHPTQKPIKLLDYLVRTYTNENETVLDFAMGSGSTGLAALNTNRKFIGIELDPNYFEIAKARLKYTQDKLTEEYDKEGA